MIWLSFALHITLLSMITIGGVSSIAPEIHRYLVEANGLITAQQFTDLYAIAQAAPGPNVLFITIMAYYVSGLAGALAVTAGMLLPATIYTSLYIRYRDRAVSPDWGRALKLGLAPLTVGLMFSISWIMVRSVDHHWISALLTGLTIWFSLRSKLNALWLIATGALIGVVVGL